MKTERKRDGGGVGFVKADGLSGEERGKKKKWMVRVAVARRRGEGETEEKEEKFQWGGAARIRVFKKKFIIYI